MHPRRLFPIMLALLVLGLSMPAFGRAGGGQGFSGGGGGGGGSRSSSSSRGSSGLSGSRSSKKIPMSSEACGGFLLLVGVILVVGLVKGTAEQWANRRTMSRIRQLGDQREGKVTAGNARVDAALAKITARDPSFQPEAFLRQAEKAFLEIQLAWSTGDFDVARHYLSDGLLKRFTVQLALNQRHGRRNVTAGVRVLGARVLSVESDDELDTVHLELRASLRDLDVPAQLSEAEAAERLARAPETAFTEYWSFVRRTNPSPEGKGNKGGKLTDGKCPACAAPVARAPTMTCEYCGAILNSGTYDWVLSEITQKGEMRGASGPVTGFARLKALDPAINRQIIEDRASLVFWKWIEAKATGQTSRFARHCTAQSLAGLGLEGAPTQSLAQTAVGSVDLVLVDSDAECDRAWCLFRWSTSGAGTGIVHTTVMQLARRAGLKTNPKSGFATDRCHHCAAFQTELDAVACNHCGATLSQDWAFVEMVSPEAFRLERQLSKQEGVGLSGSFGGIADPWERRRALTMMVAAARANGVVTSKERKLLESCAERWEIEQVQLKALLATPMENLTDIQPKSIDEARLLFRALVAAALVDGWIDAQEKKLLDAMGAHLKLQAAETATIISELKSDPSRRIV